MEVRAYELMPAKNIDTKAMTGQLCSTSQFHGRGLWIVSPLSLHVIAAKCFVSVVTEKKQPVKIYVGVF